MAQLHITLDEATLKDLMLGNRDQAITTLLEEVFNAALLARSIASPETVAHVMTRKFQLHLPLYRQAQDWASRGDRDL